MVAQHVLQHRVERAEEGDAGDDALDFVEFPIAAPIQPAETEHPDRKRGQEGQLACALDKELPGRDLVDIEEGAQKVGNENRRPKAEHDRHEIDCHHGECQP